MKKILTAALVLLSFSSLKAQVRQQLWLGYFNQTWFTPKVGLWADLHLRFLDHNDAARRQEIIRLGASYRFKEKYMFMAGAAYVLNTPSQSYEWRPWQQFAVYDHFGKTKFTYWLRYEQRLRYTAQDKYTEPFFHRIRLNALLQYPIIRKEEKDKLYAVLNNELFLQYGTHAKFDQNRSFIGLATPITKSTTLQAGYMYVLRNNDAPLADEQAHSIRVYLFQKFNF